jgi:hypothetical protein
LTGNEGDKFQVGLKNEIVSFSVFMGGNMYFPLTADVVYEIQPHRPLICKEKVSLKLKGSRFHELISNNNGNR